MKIKKGPLALVLFASLALAACSSVKKELGVSRNSPDEFAVVKRAPLTLPPDYALRPPAEPGAAADAEKAADRAKAALMGTTSAPAAAGAADHALLGKIGAAAANPDIRKVIDEENGYISLENRTVADKLIFWNDEEVSPDRAPTSVVDPKAEAERLKKNQAEGKPVNEGEVPVIEKKKSTLDKIF